MMISSKKENILIITHDLRLNRTFTSRYFSFIKSLKRKHNVKGVGIDFSFKPHPINNMDKTSDHWDVSDDIITIHPRNLNLIQKLLTLFDKANFPFFLKKYLLALHIIHYNSDQWVVNIEDLKELSKYMPTVIIAGGAGGIAETAFLLAKKHKAKLIIDYRDPWNFGYHPMQTNPLITTFKKQFTIKNELKLLAYAEKIITVSESMKLAFPEKFHHKILVVENGSNFEFEETLDHDDRPTYFTITYLGTIYDDQLFDSSFFRGLKLFIHTNNLTPDNFKLSFLGSSENKILPQMLQRFSLRNFSKITTRLTREALKMEILNTSMFLQLRHGTRSKVITSKQSDYLMFRRPILLPSTDNGDISESIISNNAGYVCDGKVDSIVKVLQLEYEKFIKGESNVLENGDLSFFIP